MPDWYYFIVAHNWFARKLQGLKQEPRFIERTDKDCEEYTQTILKGVIGNVCRKKDNINRIPSHIFIKSSD